MKKYYLIGLFAIIGILISGCSTPIPEKDVKANLNEEFQLRVNQVAYIESENIKIKFLNVTGDSRCPSSDVTCVWEGQADVLVNISVIDNSDYGIAGEYGENYGNFILISRAGNESLAIKNFEIVSKGDPGYFKGRYEIVLVKVEPYPISTNQIDISDYVITLSVFEHPSIYW